MVSNQRIIGQRFQQRSFLFLLLSTLVILLGGMIALLWQQQYNRQQTQADSAYVVSPPTLPAETVNSILAGTPMAGMGAVIEDASRNTNIDDAFALGVWWAETNDGAAGVGLSYRNPGGVRSSAGYPVGGGGYTIYPSYATAIYDWFNIIESRYINRGLTTVYTISYPYVGTSGAPSWANKVFNLMVRYHAMAPAPTPTPPPPTPTPTPTPSPTPRPRDWEQEQPMPLVHTKKSVPPVTKQKSTLANATNATLPTLSAKGENLIVGIGLLGATMLAGFGIIVRRRVQIPVASISSTLPVTTGLVIDNFNKLDTSPLTSNPLLPASNSYASSLIASEFEPLEATSEPATAPILAVSGGGLLTRFGSTGIGPHSLPAKTPIIQPERVSSINEQKGMHPQAFDSTYDQGPTTTAGLPSVRPSISLPIRRNEASLELMAAGKTPQERPRGLLSRYADN